MSSNNFENEEINSEKLKEVKKDIKEIPSNEIFNSDILLQEEKEIIKSKSESSENSPGLFNGLKRLFPWNKKE